MNAPMNEAVNALSEPESGDARTQAALALHDVLIACSWEEALRTALQLEHGGAGCSRRSCQEAGACQVRWTEGKPIACGGGVPDSAIATAAALVHFGGMMVLGFLEQIAIPERMEAVRTARKAALSPDVPSRRKARRGSKPH